MSRTLLGSLAAELDALLQPITLAVEDAGWREHLLHVLGILEPGQAQPLLDLIAQVVALRERITALAAEESPSFEGIAAVLDSADLAFAAIRRLDESGTAPAVRGLAEALVQALVGTHLMTRYPLLYRLLELLTVIQPGAEAPPTDAVLDGEDMIRQPIAIARIRPRRLIDLLQDPVAVLKREYLNDLATAEQAAAAGDRLFPRIANVLSELDVAWTYGLDPDSRALLGDHAPLLEHALTIFLLEQIEGAPADAGVMLAFSSADMGDLGLVASPFGALSLTRQAGPWTFLIEFTADVQAVAYGRHGLTLVASPGTVNVGGRVTATLRAPDQGPAFVLGSPTGTRLEIGAAAITFETSLSQARQTLAFNIDLSPASFVLASSDGDGFLASLLPREGMTTKFDFGVGWSNEKGVTFKGQASLDTTIPVGRSIAGITLTSVHIGLQARDGRIAGDVSITLNASIGPVRALIDRIGIDAELTFPEEGRGGGNVGIGDLDLGFKPPSGIGLTIDAKGVVTGGGALIFDTNTHVYAGVLQLSIQDLVTVTAFGLITTRLPDGSRGYSLLVFITAEGFKPVPLGLGFMLTGIGGLIAVHRTFSEEALREGMQRDTLSALLFPKDPIGNAPAIVRALGAAFPVRTGSYLFGLMARITWFTPALLTMDLALVFEFGRQRRLLILGRIAALLPSEKNDLVRVKLNAVGVVDFDQGTAVVDAVLVDSRLAKKFVLTGAAAFRARWTSGPGAGFILAVGGVNPRFAPPSNLPALARITVALSSGDNPRLTCDAYFAVTANTLQFGARAEVYAGAHGFSIEGDMGFDVLIQFVPFHFIADFQASVQLKRGSRRLFKVSLEGSLEGPRPLRVSGKASFEILWCDFSVRFDKTLISGERPPRPAAVDVAAELRKALASGGSWSTRRAANRQGISLGRAALPTAIVLDPLGTLVVKQAVVPLNTARDLDTFGGAPINGARRFAVTATLGTLSQTVRPVRDQFAPSQFFSMTDDEKLSSPSFEEMEAGIEFGSEEPQFEAVQAVAAALEFETIVVDDMAREPAPADPPPPRYVLSSERLRSLTRTGSVAMAAVRTAGLARFRNQAAPIAATLRTADWTLVTEEGAPAEPDPQLAQPRTWIETRDLRDRLLRRGELVHMEPRFKTGT